MQLCPTLNKCLVKVLEYDTFYKTGQFYRRYDEIRKKQHQNLTHDIRHKAIVYFEEESLESAANCADCAVNFSELKRVNYCCSKKEYVWFLYEPLEKQITR